MGKRVSWVGSAAALVLLSLPTCQAQVVQLPSIHRFSVNTTVWVPDRGSTSLGSIHSARDASLRRGANRSFASQRGMAGTDVRATIIDLDELDQAALAEAQARNQPFSISPADRLARRVGAGLSGEAATSKNDAGHSDLASLRRRASERADAQRQEALTRLERAEKLRAAGNIAQAKIWYRMAYNSADESLRLEIVRRHRALAEQGESTTGS